MTKTLWRAANDDIITDVASFAESRAAAEYYRDNPGFGGATIYRARVTIDPALVLDVADVADPVQAIMDACGIDTHPGAIGADEWVPRIADKIAAAGYEWARVAESYPEDTVTWIWLAGDEPEMVEA